MNCTFSFGEDREGSVLSSNDDNVYWSGYESYSYEGHVNGNQWGDYDQWYVAVIW